MRFTVNKCGKILSNSTGGNNMGLPKNIDECIKQAEQRDGRLYLGAARGLEDSDMSELVRMLNEHPKVIKLELPHNAIETSGAITLSKLQHIKTLNLSGNSVGRQGAISLAQNPSIQHLDLSNNDLGWHLPYVDVMTELEPLTTTTKQLTLDLSGNLLSQKCIRQVKRCLAKNNILAAQNEEESAPVHSQEGSSNTTRDTFFKPHSELPAASLHIGLPGSQTKK